MIGHLGIRSRATVSAGRRQPHQAGECNRGAHTWPTVHVPITNQAGLTPRVIRGGDFTGSPSLLRATKRASKPATTVDPYTGFRCAR